MSTLDLQTARVFQPLLQPARYKAAYGGRGSGKSHFFAESLLEDCLAEKGMLAVCIREVQKTLAQSSKRLLEKKIAELGLGREFPVFTDRIKTPGDGIIIFQGMQDHTAESIKSLEGFRRAWVEEAQTLSSRSLTLLRPTIRADGSQIWAGWNPSRKTDAVDAFFRAETPANAIVVQANWRDNPWFPKELEEERQLDLAKYPDRYEHIWEGGYVTALAGAYFARDIATAKSERRIGGTVARDALLPVKAFWDIGVSDATAIWIAQWVGREIRVIDYYEAVGQPLAAHVEWLRSNGYGNAECYLPHDSDQRDAVTAIRFEDHIRAAGFKVTTVPNQGKGAALKRVEAARRIFAGIWFNTPKVEGGLDALGWYHELQDEKRGIGLGPEHDWSSHAADAFGLMCVAYEEPVERKRPVRVAAGSWMGG